MPPSADGRRHWYGGRSHLETAGLARQEWPESLYVVAELPRTPSGKVQELRLRQALREGTLAQ